MRKRLLLQLLFVAIALTVNAQAGPYIYTRNAKFKITGTNLVENGAFANGWGTQWKNELGQEPSGAAWQVNTEKGPNFEAVAESASASLAEGTLLTTLWAVQANQTYAVSYYVKAPEATTCNIIKGSSSYFQFYLSADGSATDSIAVSSQESFGIAWTKVAFTFTVEDATKPILVFCAGNMPSGTMFTNFEIYPVQEVYDTRNVDRLSAYIDKLSKDENLPKEKDILEEAKDEIANIMTTASSENAETMTSFLNETIEPMIQDFIDANSGDTRSGDWSTRGGAGWNKLNNATVAGSWKTIGSRWGFSPNDESLGRPMDDGYVLTGGIQKGMDMGTVGVEVTRTDGILPAGKYFFSIEAQAVAVSAKNYDDNYKPYDYTRPVTGLSIWVGTDTLVMRPANDVELENTASKKKYAAEVDTLSGDYWKRYYHIAEIGEDTPINAGILIPGYSDSKGGVYSLRNPQFRLIGKTSVQLSYDLDVRDMKTQQEALKARIDAYPTDVAELPWGKDSLNIAIANAQEILNASYLMIDAEGNSQLDVTQESVNKMEDQYDYEGNVKEQGMISKLKAQVTAMNNAKKWIQNRNAIQETIKTIIDEAKASRDAESNATATSATRSALQTAINEAQALVDAIATINGIDATNAKYDEFSAAILKIKQARMDFEVTVATRANPSEIYQFQNPCFEAWTSNTNYGSTTTANGWNFIKPSGSGIDYIKLTVDNSAYESGKGINCWRGSSVTMDAKVQQSFKLTHKGLYEYRAKAQAADDIFNDMTGVSFVTHYVAYWDEELQDYDYETQTTDTIYNPAARLFFGYDGRPDSIAIYKGIGVGGSNSTPCTKTWRGINQRTPWSYSTFYLKADNTEEPCEVGFENVGGGAINGWGFGDNHIYYVGDANKYLQDLKTEIVTDSVKARNLANKLEQTEKDAGITVGSSQSSYFIVYKLNRFIINGLESTINAKMEAKTPKITKDDDKLLFTVKEMQNAWLSINEMAQILQGCIDYITGIEPITFQQENAKKEAARGIYTISGVRVEGDINSLQRGLYIINGKKVVIK